MCKEFNIETFDSKKNICIEASAGTGKTYTVQQIVAKLLVEGRSLENILIVTYTEKAAGELKDRIRSILKEKELYEQLALVDNAPIFTIHSFCKQALKEFSIESHQTDDLDLIDEGEVSDFIKKWIRDELENNPGAKRYYSSGNNIKVKAYVEGIKKYYLDYSGNEVPEIIQLDKMVDEETAQKILVLTPEEISVLLSSVKSNKFDFMKLNEILNAYEKIEGKEEEKSIFDERTMFIDNVKSLVEELKNLQKDQNKQNRKKCIDDVWTDEKIDELKNTTNSLYFLELKKENFFGEDYLNKNEQEKGINVIKLKKYFTELKDKISTVKKWKNPLKDSLERYLFQTQIPEIYKAWIQYKKDNKFQSFDDMIRNVREEVCKENSQLKEALKKKYTYAIIDEFQDTNQKQWDIFKRIFMEDEDHSICVVGDPKQSIYAFQGADVTVYKKAQKEILDQKGEKFQLKKNYRSTNKIINFCNDFFEESHFFNKNESEIEFAKSECPEKDQKSDATFNGEEVQPVWVPPVGDKEEIGLHFAQFVVTQIIECCQKDSLGKTNLQVYNKKEKKRTNVTFSDFAVLCRSKSEMEELKYAFEQSGIPYNHYKEANLFGGKECLDWIALFKAIAAPDFSSSNRKVLNECLFSSFFEIPIDKLKSTDFDKQNNPERIKIIKWKKIAQERNWAYLQERIYADSEVEKRLSKLDKLTNLSKLRQIGDYSVNYLYKNNCSIDNLVNHLSLLQKNIDGADDEGGELIEKGTDFDAVKIMTIHASKGLEFPVVIVAAGFNESPPSNGVYAYHHKNGEHHLCNDNKTYKDNRHCDEAEQECRRLFYVAYTRASSLIISPWKANEEYEFLNEAFANSGSNTFLRKIPYNPKEYTPEENKKKLHKILGDSASKDNCTDSEGSEEKQIKVLKEFAQVTKSLNTYKHSYSNLSHGQSNHLIESDEDFEHERNRSVGNAKDNSEYDKNHIDIACDFDKEKITKISDNYPKGSLLGEAVHQVFEEVEFNRVGSLAETAVIHDKKLCALIHQKFKSQGFFIDENDSEQWLAQTCHIVWNTLNSVFPEIKGSKKTEGSFSLKDLADNQHFAELEFNMNPEISHNQDFMKNYFNGFIDLVFVHETSKGEKVYSILDWKTDSMLPESYANQEETKTHTDKNYSIQRVLYSYCLIKWLKQFNKDKDESWIFENLFGGIYYVYVRGCKNKSGNGLYAQTWESWKQLEDAFNSIVEKKLPGGQN